MSTIAPGRFFTVTDTASFVALSQQNWDHRQRGTVSPSPHLPEREPLGPRESRIANRKSSGTSPFPIPHSPAKEFVCTAAGTTGTWRQIAPAAVTADPDRGTFPFGYLILNTTDGGLKPHAGGLSWEVQIGAGASVKVGFHGATPTHQRASPDQAEATDLASVSILANELRATLLEKGLIKGTP